jgi:hypothetical protein
MVATEAKWPSRRRPIYGQMQLASAIGNCYRFVLVRLEKLLLYIAQELPTAANQASHAQHFI